MFTCEQYGIIPDMLVIGKALGGGVMPIAALLAREDLDIGQERALGHFTHEKNPVACAAALATLEVIESEALPQRAGVLGTHFMQQLRSLQTRHPLIHEVRGLGLLVALVLRNQDGSSADAEAEQIMYRALSRGLSFKVTMGSILVLTPPLNIAEEQLEEAVQILDSCFREGISQTIHPSVSSD
jgi:4-aminobutyrate aminotransferase